MRKCVIFDMDGTLLFTLDDLHCAVNSALAVYGFPSKSWDEVKGFVGNGVKKLIERAIPFGVNNPCYEKVLSEFYVQYEKNSDALTKPYEGVVELLDELKRKGVLIGVNSNKYDTAVQFLCDKFFPQIDVAVGARDGIDIKPSPAGVYEILEEFGGQFDECFFVGDSDIDIMTAKNANFVSVGVTWGYRSEETLVSAGADYIIDYPQELLLLV